MHYLDSKPFAATTKTAAAAAATTTTRTKHQHKQQQQTHIYKTQFRQIHEPSNQYVINCTLLYLRKARGIPPRIGVLLSKLLFELLRENAQNYESVV